MDGAEGTWLRCLAGLSVRVDTMCPIPPQHVGEKLGAEGRSERVSGGWGIPEGLHVGRALKMSGGFPGKVGVHTRSAVTSRKKRLKCRNQEVGAYYVPRAGDPASVAVC